VTAKVSVVIPTRNRPALVTRAVTSALAQTMAELEVVVVVDGPDPATVDALGAIGDERLRVVELPKSGGAQNARNTGIGHARGEWTALLDDDDEWLPEKLERQLAVAEPGSIVASRLYMRTPRADTTLPRRLPEPGQPLSEYLVCRRGLFHGDGFIQTSTIMAPTALFRAVPFTVGLRRLQELDWTLRCLARDGVSLVYAETPLVIWYADENRPRVSFDAPWKQQFEWLKDSRPRLTKKAYAALAMSVVSSMAAPTRSPRVCLSILREAQRNGRPSALDYVAFAQIWLVPRGLRHKVRDRLGGRRHTVEPVGAAGGARSS
jgi:glycosyltransferase involved in cell wall biosynthesis